MLKRTFTCGQAVMRALATAALLVFVNTGPLRAQSYYPLFRPYSSAQTVYYYCWDPINNRYLYNCPISLNTFYYVGTNAHWHEQYPHPFSSIACINPWWNYCSTTSWAQSLSANTGVFASVGLYIGTTIVGQAEYIRGVYRYYCGDPYSYCESTDYFEYAVGYDDLYYNHHPEIWVKIGGTDTGANTGHGTTDYNRYMKLNSPNFNDGPAYRIYYATLDYLNEHPGVSRICLNDMALPFGGKFDVCNLPGTPGCRVIAPWNSPHIEHDRGTAVDVATTTTQCTAERGGRPVEAEAFLAKCRAHGGAWSHNEGNHVHCGFEDPATFPH